MAGPDDVPGLRRGVRETREVLGELGPLAKFETLTVVGAALAAATGVVTFLVQLGLQTWIVLASRRKYRRMTREVFPHLVALREVLSDPRAAAVDDGAASRELERVLIALDAQQHELVTGYALSAYKQLWRYGRAAGWVT